MSITSSGVLGLNIPTNNNYNIQHSVSPFKEVLSVNAVPPVAKSSLIRSEQNLLSTKPSLAIEQKNKTLFIESRNSNEFILLESEKGDSFAAKSAELFFNKEGTLVDSRGLNVVVENKEGYSGKFRIQQQGELIQGNNGKLTPLFISEDGNIVGREVNGMFHVYGHVAIKRFVNEAGFNKFNGLFQVSSSAPENNKSSSLNSSVDSVPQPKLEYSEIKSAIINLEKQLSFF